MKRARVPRWPSALAGAVVLASLVVLGASAWDVVAETDELPVAVTPSGGREPADVRPPPPLDSVLAVVRIDPFHPQRLAPTRRFSAAGPEVETAPVATGAPRITGTALSSAGRSFVLAAIGADGPRIVRLGDTLGVYELVAVRDGEAEFRFGDERLTVSVPRIERSPR